MDSTKTRIRPQQIKGIPGKVVKLASGVYHSLALLESGEVYGWGLNIEGQLGDKTRKARKRPQPIKGFPGKVIDITAGAYHSMALLESGEVYAWGRNSRYELGDGTSLNKLSPQLVKTLPDKVVSIAAGYYHSLALLNGGEVYGWGSNYDGRLGDGKLLEVHLPRIICIVEKRILLSPFGKGGRAVGYGELEIKFRELLSQAFIL